MPSWLNDAVFYEIYPQSYYDANGDGIGDLQGIIARLDYIKSLGCNALWLNPMYDSPFMDAGYDVRDYKKVAARYGTNADAKQLFETAHQKGIHVLLDLVPGHTSDEHAWFKASADDRPSEYDGRYIWSGTVWETPPPYKWLTGIVPRDGSYMVNFFSSQPALNYGFAKRQYPWQLPPEHPHCQATVEAVKDVMRFWLDMGCDGFRVDMAESLVKDDDAQKTATSALWAGVRAMLDAEYPEAAMVSEWSCPRSAVGMAGFHMDFYLDHPGYPGVPPNGYHHLFRQKDDAGNPIAVFKKNGRGDITRFLEEYAGDLDAIRGKGYISLISGNHDTPRLSPFLDDSELPLALSFLFLMPGVPFLYYGDEIGMRYQAGMPTKEGGYQRTGSRTPMQWNAGANAGFSTAPAESLYLPVDPDPAAPNVSAQENNPGSLLNTVRRVLALRHAQPDLQADGPFAVVYAQKNAFPFVLRRGRFLIAVNPTEKEQAAPLPKAGEAVFVLGGYRSADGMLVMAPQSLAVLRAE